MSFNRFSFLPVFLILLFSFQQTVLAITAKETAQLVKSLQLEEPAGKKINKLLLLSDYYQKQKSYLQEATYRTQAESLLNIDQPDSPLRKNNLFLAALAWKNAKKWAQATEKLQRLEKEARDGSVWQQKAVETQVEIARLSGNNLLLEKVLFTWIQFEKVHSEEKKQELYNLLIDTAEQNDSPQIFAYFQGWFNVIENSSSLRFKKALLTKWVRLSLKKNSQNEFPFRKLTELLEQTGDIQGQRDIRLLFAEHTGKNQTKTEQLEWLYQDAVKNKRSLPAGLLEELVTFAITEKYQTLIEDITRNLNQVVPDPKQKESLLLRAIALSSKKDIQPLEITLRRALVPLISTKTGNRKEKAFTNLYRLGVLESRNEQYVQAASSFSKALELTDLKETNRRNLLLQHLFRVNLKAGNDVLAEKHLAVYVLATAKSSTFEQSSGGFRQLIITSRRNQSEHTNKYFQNWYEVALETAPPEEVPVILTQWVNFIVETPEQYTETPFIQLAELYREQANWPDLSQVLILQAQQLKDKPEAFPIYAEAHQVNRQAGIKTSLGILTLLYNHYKTSGQTLKQHAVLIDLSERDDYEFKNQALKEAANLSVKIEDWLSALETHKKLLTLVGDDKPLEKTPILKNLVRISERLTRDSEFFQYVEESIKLDETGISKEEKYQFFTRYEDKRVTNREFSEGLDFYTSVISQNIFQNTDYLYKIHLYGGRLAELSQNLSQAQNLYQTAIQSIPPALPSRNNVIIAVKNKMVQLIRAGGRPLDTIQLLTEIRELQKTENQEAQLANTTLLLAQAYDDAVQPDKAYVFYSDALNLFKKTGNKTLETEILTLLANRDSGSIEVREQRLKELQKAQSESGDTRAYLSTSLELGNLYLQYQKPDLAEAQYKRVTDTTEKNVQSIQIRAFYQLASLKNNQNNPDEALSLLNAIEPLFQTIASNNSIRKEAEETFINASLYKANLLLSRDQPALAEKELNRISNLAGDTFRTRLLKAFADLWYNQSKHTQTVNYINRQLKQLSTEEKPEAYFLIARAEFGRGRSLQSDNALKKAKEWLKNPEASTLMLDIMNLEARIQITSEKTEEAIQTQYRLADLAEKQKEPEYFQDAVLRLAEIHLQAGRVSEALKESDRFKPFQEKSSLNRKLRYWLISAETLQKQNKFEASLAQFERIDTHTKTLAKSNPFFARYFYLKGLSYLQLLNFDEAYNAFQQSGRVYSQNDQSNLSLQSKLAQANTRLQQGKLNDAEKILSEIERKASKDKALRADVQNGFALLYSEAGQYEKALNYSSRAEKSYEQAGLKTQVPEVLNTRALIYLKLKDFRQSEIIFTKALELNKPYNNPLLDAQILNNLGGLYQSTGDLRKARQQLIKTAELQKSLGFESELALTYNNIGSVYLSQNKFKESLSFLKQARDYAQKYGLKKELAQSWNNEGIVYFRQKKFSDAEKAFENARGLQEELALQLDLSRTMNNLSIIASQDNDTEKALNMIQGAIKALSLNSLDDNAFYPNPSLNEIIAPDLMKNYLQNKGSFLKKLAANEDDNKYRYLEAAYSSFSGSIDLVEALRNQIKSEESQQLLFAENIDVFQQLIAILYDLGVKYPKKDYHEKAFLYSELSRARTFLDQLQEQAARTSFKLPDDMAAKENRLKRRLTTLDQNIFEELSKRKSKRNNQKVEEWQLEKSKVQIEFKNLTEELEKKFPAYASLKYPKVFGVQDLAKTSAKEDSIVIAYMVGEDRSFGWSIGAKHFRMVALPPNGDIDKLIRKYRKTLVNPLVYPDEYDEEIVVDNTKTHLAIGLQLYRTILEPLLKDTSKANKLVVIPDGVIYYLPLETVVSSIKAKATKQMPGGREYMLHKYSLVYTPSASVQGAIKMQKRARNQSVLKQRKAFLGFGDPQFKPSRRERKKFKKDPTFKRQGFYDLSRLFNTIRELKAIKTLFKGTEKTFLRKKALESNVKKNISSFKYIHFATHGILDEKNPEYSGVVMNIIQKDNPEDGFLQASEIFDLNLNAELVTLSACETGLGKVIKGEGMVGLTRAFLFAGTPSIVVSLWTVADESTSNLMIHFYNYLKQGLNKDEALQRAKLKLMAQVNRRTGVSMADPFYWGPFVLNGTR